MQPYPNSDEKPSDFIRPFDGYWGHWCVEIRAGRISAPIGRATPTSISWEMVKPIQVIELKCLVQQWPQLGTLN